MAKDAAKALQHETAFLSGVETNLEAAKGRDLRGSIWQRSQSDESDRLRALLASNRIFDRERLKALPANRRVALHGFERRFLFGKRRTGVAIASVLSPLSHYASAPDTDAPPIGLGELMDHVRKLVGDSRVDHVVGVCCPTGLTDEARSARVDLPGVVLVLIEPDEAGGWRTRPASENVEPRVLKLFDPEKANEKLERVRDVIEAHSADLLTGGLSVSSVMAGTNLPEEVVRQGFEKAAAADPELRLSKKEGAFLLFRGAPAQRQERKSMNVIERIRQLFSGEGAEAEKVNLLAERRAALAQRRDRIYEDIGKLEKKEADLFEQGKAATSQVPRRRLAAQLAQLRKDIARQNATAAMLNKQIDIISTDIHNLTLIQQGELAKLPDTAELTENAVRAEEMLETLVADAELVGSLETGIEESLTSEDEQAILREFEQAAEPSSAAAEPTRTAEAPAAPKRAESGPVGTSPAPEREPGADEPPEPDSGQRRADAEPS
jgi:hypothetical protein